MRKVFGLLLCLAVVPMLFAATGDTDNPSVLQVTSPEATHRVLHGQNRVWDSRLVLYSAIPDTVNSANMACQLDSVYPFEADEADDINPTANWNVDTVISWWWCWNGFSSWTLVPNIHMVVYDDASGQPAVNPNQEVVIEQANYAAFVYVSGQRWRVEAYTSGVLSIPSGLQWFEIQPSTVFTSNGQTGIIGEPGCGNSVQGWFRSSVLGYPNWTANQTVFGSPNEAGMVILGTEGGGATHDVGCTGISAPPTQVMPNSSHNPMATYRNFGSSNETFDVYFDIDSAGTNVYSETYNITVNSGEDTTITFATWDACGTDGIVYNCYAYTVLSGDENPANDTATRNVTVVSKYWEILDPPALPHAAAGFSMATVEDGYVWAMRVKLTSTYLPDCDRYDVANDVWDASYTSDPYGAGAYGTAHGVNGKIYCVGGTSAWPTGLTRVDIYDPGSNSWSSGATSPAPLCDHASSVYDNRYIITFGNGNWGQTPTNEVYVYDTELDTWAAGTFFPGTARGTSAFGIIDTFAVGACGYLSNGTYGNDYIVGIIDPADPTNITWGSWATIPGMAGRYRVPSSQDTYNQCVWVINGQNGPFADTWSYDPYTDTWTDWGQPKPAPIGNLTPLAVTTTLAGDIGVFAAGGYNGSYITDVEVFHTGYVPGVNEIPGKVPVASIGFAPMMNPVKDHVAITYTTDRPATVTLKVYDYTGRVIRTLVNNRSEAQGTKTVHWNGKDDAKREVANGVYFFTLEAAGQTATYKVTLVK
jgi:hypothetical protein